MKEVCRERCLTLQLFCAALILHAADAPTQSQETSVVPVLARLRAHEFHPIRDGFTFDTVKEHGVADLNDMDWKVRLLVIRDLVRLGTNAAPDLIRALRDKNAHVRHASAMTLGILQINGAVPALIEIMAKDSDSVVRSQAAVALAQIGQRASLGALQSALTNDSSRDVKHQAELAVYAVEKGIRPSPDLTRAYAALDETQFGIVKVGAPAPDFSLPDTEGKTWRLSDFHGKKDVALIWVFADWCPVCHGEFRELIEMKTQFAAAGVQVFTIECHDTFPARVMVGKELEPHYWFSKKSFKHEYTEKIWWPHLVDRAGAVGASYGVQPMAFVVHSDWINRPSVVIVDQAGLVRFTYYGTFWGDRPSIHKTLQMITTRNFDYENPKRRKAPPNAR